MISLDIDGRISNNLREQQGAEDGHLLLLLQVAAVAAEATEAVKAATARVAKRTMVARGQEDTRNFHRQIRDKHSWR
jgi:hypothetical protein